MQDLKPTKYIIFNYLQTGSRSLILREYELVVIVQDEVNKATLSTKEAMAMAVRLLVLLNTLVRVSPV